MVRSLRCVIAAVCVASAFAALPGCNSSPGTGDKKADEVTFKGIGSMPPDAMSKMRSAQANAGNKAQEPHGGTADASQAANQVPGQPPAAALQAAKDRAQQSHGPNQ